jgi:ethanolamine ammonia-lyase large subunit
VDSGKTKKTEDSVVAPMDSAGSPVNSGKTNKTEDSAFAPADVAGFPVDSGNTPAESGGFRVDTRRKGNEHGSSSSLFGPVMTREQEPEEPQVFFSSSQTGVFSLQSQQSLLQNPHIARSSRLARRGFASSALPAPIPAPAAPLDVFSFIEDHTMDRNPNATAQGKKIFACILGNANEFKEGDATIGVAAKTQEERLFARALIAQTTIQDIESFPYNEDQVYSLCRKVSKESAALTSHWTIGELKEFLLAAPDVQPVLPGLSSDVVACVVELMSNQELVQLGAKVFNPIPGTKLGAKGYFGARVQPNSPTDDPEDVFWQVMNAFSFGVGDFMLGTNPVSSDPKNVLAVQRVLKQIVDTFQIELPYCVLAHIDIQAKLETEHPGSTSLWFQSIAGSDAANQTFDLPVDKMLTHADKRSGEYGLYLETGKGADFTNGHSLGVDMLMHDSRKYGFARALSHRVGKAQPEFAPKIYIKNVAGFIGVSLCV